MYIKDLQTEKVSDINLAEFSTYQLAKMMNEEDKKVAFKVEQKLDDIAKATDYIIESIKNSGRVFYIGAGTSGRLGVLDASECPPTFGVDDNLFIGLIAGGYKSLYKAQEKEEDNPENAINDLKKHNLNKADIVVGISASGYTPYVIGALKYAKEVGCKTICICTNKEGNVKNYADIPIIIEVGKEFIAGSTRLKSGTAQKMVLNMLSTISMIKLGYVYKDVMINIRPNSKKLYNRAISIIMHYLNVDFQEATSIFKRFGGNLRRIIEEVKPGND